MSHQLDVDFCHLNKGSNFNTEQGIVSHDQGEEKTRALLVYVMILSYQLFHPALLGLLLKNFNLSMLFSYFTLLFFPRFIKQNHQSSCLPLVIYHFFFFSFLSKRLLGILFSIHGCLFFCTIHYVVQGFGLSQVFVKVVAHLFRTIC